MKRFDRNISAFDAALEQRPEVFQSVSVDMAFGVALRVIDHLVDVFICQPVIRRQRICVNFRALLNVLTNRCFNIMSAYAPHYFAANARMFFRRVSLKQSHDSRFANRTALSTSGSRTSIFVHVARLAANKSLIGLNTALHLLLNRAVSHRQPDAVKHEPSCLLSYSDRPSKLARSCSIL